VNRPRRIPLALAAACYVLALVQRPGLVYADTKIDLYVDPHGFLADVLSAWSPQLQLGYVFGGQYGGYLFPMAPWFALGDLAGLPTWLVHRLWLGTVLAVAALGVVRLLDALLDRPRGAPHVAAAVLFVLNPYIAVYASRTSITLLAYAALPWLLLAVHHGLREPRAWRWPALFALVLTCTGGGVNVAVTVWVLVGPLLFVLYERWFGGVGRGAIGPFLLRLAPVVLVANAWWLAPVLVHFRYGLDFLPFTEQPGTIWQTTSITESLRLMGFWTSYIGLGFGGVLRPYASHAPVLLFHPAVLVASLVVPALALGSFAWTRRWRYGPWFLLLALTGLLIMVTGFPEGTPLRRALTFTYNQVEAVQFLRTTYKAGPLLALGLACLGGAAFGLAWDRLGRWVAVPLAGLVAVAAWPLTTGRAPEPQLRVDVPAYWEEAARAVADLPAGERVMVMPGKLFAYYDWGGTIDPVLPAMARRPVAERMIVPFSDLRAVDLQFSTDALVSQERALPGQLPPLLDLMGVGALVTNADDDRSRSGGLGAVEAQDVLRSTFGEQAGPAGDDRGGPAVPDAGVPEGHGADDAAGARRAFGPLAPERPAPERVRPDEELPRITMRKVQTGGMVRVLPRAGTTVVDGGAEGIGALAAFGDLDTGAPLRYAADAGADEIRRASAVVITDTNRRQAYVAARMKANRGQVLAADQELSEDGAMLDPFDAGPDAQTVSVLRGVRSVWSPFSPQVTQFAEHRPYAALDGDEDTAWLGDRALDTGRHWMEVRLGEARDIDAIDVLPYNDERGVVEAIEVNGRRVPVGAGWNRVRVGERTDTLRIRIASVRQPPGVTGGAGGIRELRIPGVRVTEALRPPVLAERALRGSDFPGALTYLFSRFTVDAPRRSADAAGRFQTALLRDRQDPERRLRRTIDVPVERAWRFDAWTSIAPDAEDTDLDRLAGTTGTVRATGSGRYEGRAAHRASRAFDGDRDTAWIAPWDGRGAWLEARLDRPRTLRRLRLVPPAETVRVPRRVTVTGDGGEPVTAAVGADGSVVLPGPLTARRLRLTVEDAAFPAGTPGRRRQRRAVGIAEIEGLGAGARVRDAAPGAPLAGRCGDATVATRAGRVRLRAAGTVADLDDGALFALPCGGPRELPAGRQEIADRGGILRLDRLRMADRVRQPPAATGLEVPAASGPELCPGGGPCGEDPATMADEPPAAGRVVDPGRDDRRGARDGVRVEVDRPAWLVLGESYNEAWRAECDGRDLGAPVPIQGFANGWKVEPGCRDVSFAWAPNRLLPPAYLLSLAGCLVLLGVLLRQRPRPAPADRPLLPDDEPVTRVPLRRALAAGVVAGVVLGFVFALRAGVVIGPAVALILWAGIPARRLALAGGAILAVAVPIAYLVIPAEDHGGFNTNLAVERIAAHWIGVAGVVLLGAALCRSLAAARAAHPDRPRLPGRRGRVRDPVPR
jgi:hypothetical protein